MVRFRSVSLWTAALLVAGLLAGASPASATSTNDDVGVQAVYFDELKRPGVTNAPPEDCGERRAPDGGRAYICYSYGRYSDGLAYGYYRGTVYGATFVQIALDSGIDQTTTRPDIRGIFANTRAIYFAACTVAAGCGPFS